MEQLPQGILEGNIDGFRKKEFLYKFSIDTWADDLVLKEYTFPTIIVPITCDEGKELLAYHNDIIKGKDNPSEIIEEVARRVDRAIQELGGAAFVKMNHRSPKDVAVLKTNTKAKKILLDKLAKIPDDNKCAQSIAFIRSILESLKVTSGKEALQLLANSFRVSEDLISDTEYPEFFKSKIVVRQFIKVDPAFEFRAFVSKGKLTALSQYESGMYFPDLAAQPKVVEDIIVSFWESIRHRIQLQDYVIDFCILSDGRVFIVELNPFHAHTSACRFTWKADREIILNGPFTFRYASEPSANILSVGFSYWNDVITQYYYKQKLKRNVLIVAATVVGVAVGAVVLKKLLSK